MQHPKPTKSFPTLKGLSQSMRTGRTRLDRKLRAEGFTAEQINAGYDRLLKELEDQ